MPASRGFVLDVNPAAGKSRKLSYFDATWLQLEPGVVSAAVAQAENEETLDRWLSAVSQAPKASSPFALARSLRLLPGGGAAPASRDPPPLRHPRRSARTLPRGRGDRWPLAVTTSRLATSRDAARARNGMELRSLRERHRWGLGLEVCAWLASDARRDPESADLRRPTQL